MELIYTGLEQFGNPKPQAKKPKPVTLEQKKFMQNFFGFN